MVYDIFDMLASILLTIFASMFIKNIGLSCSLLVVSLLGFGMSVMLALYKEFGNVPTLCIFWKSLRRTGVYSFKGLVKFGCEFSLGPSL
jgi:uncharacterized membrane protein